MIKNYYYNHKYGFVKRQTTVQTIKKNLRKKTQISLK